MPIPNERGGKLNKRLRRKFFSIFFLCKLVAVPQGLALDSLVQFVMDGNVSLLSKVFLVKQTNFLNVNPTTGNQQQAPVLMCPMVGRTYAHSMRERVDFLPQAKVCAAVTPLSSTHFWRPFFSFRWLLVSCIILVDCCITTHWVYFVALSLHSSPPPLQPISSYRKNCGLFYCFACVCVWGRENITAGVFANTFRHERGYIMDSAHHHSISITRVSSLFSSPYLCDYTNWIYLLITPFIDFFPLNQAIWSIVWPLSSVLNAHRWQQVPAYRLTALTTTYLHLCASLLVNCATASHCTSCSLLQPQGRSRNDQAHRSRSHSRAQCQQGE